jgi:hypothetical protein
MRKFSSYGLVDKDLHYYVPRQELVDRACQQLLGENPAKGGHYITVWAPRQRGKSWVMQQAAQHIKARDDFEMGILMLQSAKNAGSAQDVRDILVRNMSAWFERELPRITSWQDLPQLFTSAYFKKPLILILDEFDALPQADIQACADAFRDMFIQRQLESDKSSEEKHYRLHGLALIGVRAVLGIENQTGSPFNIQRSLHIPNLTEAEVNEMYRWYERESGQKVEQAVIDRVFYETQGQPGLVSWLGELLTETYNENTEHPITLDKFEQVYSAAIQALPNNNILNIISKAREEPYQDLVLELFKTGEKIPFTYDDDYINFLYLNGVIDWERESLTERYVKFPCPFVQKRLFNYFARTLFREAGQLHAPFEDLSDTITDDDLNVENLLRRYEEYLKRNRDWLLKDAPRRADLRVREAVYHFNLYMYLSRFLQPHDGRVWPEFPTGNGKADLIIRHAGKTHVVEVKSFSTRREYLKALGQAARYAGQLELTEITLALFVEAVDDANRARYEVVYEDEKTGVTVRPVFVATGA